MAAAALGLVLLWRKGFRLEAALIGVLSLGYVVYNSGYVVPFGGGSPGARFLIPILPFLALGLAAAYRSWPWATLALALPSGLIMLGVTAINPVYAPGWSWTDRIVDGSFTGAGVGPKVPLAIFALAGAVLAARATAATRPGVRKASGALLALGAYVGLAFAGPQLAGTDPRLLALLVVASVLAVVVWHRGFAPLWVRRPPNAA